ncbi:DUF3606 domain-containing protein [Paraflavitalea sp. CAU 1676]|uniref:DUF3606 domain-containing protein n=1 Tax=Paraflavitalea sp. CAU 1676 TaxID=3032598 RepID=UPI0023DBFA08|nr:DUF3606 domain-containing protein [Paraflavitalea sp. CAU 1676]MDF2191276.1 DUF3606 domain-containing protein [Paraflavitalea sp. CAU 1676]
MSDSNPKLSKQDDIRVNPKDPSEVEYFQRKFPDKTYDEVAEAIKAAGPLRADIETYLRKGHTGL